MPSTDVEKYIPSYPSIDEDEFSYEMARKKEFQDLKLPPSEPVPKVQGTPLLSQELQSRFFSPNTPFQSGLLFHGVGTGKSCLSSLIIENFKNTMVGGVKRKRALVIVPNEDLARSYRREVAFRCTEQGIYTPKLTEGEMRQIQKGASVQMNDLTYEKRLRASVAKSYEIVTYESFFFSTSGVYGEGESGDTKPGIIGMKTKPRHTNVQITKNKYSDRVIIIDEVHNFREQPTEKKDKKNLLTQETISGTHLYQEAHKFLHTVENCRVILLSGTPIWDQPYELAGVMNLILPKNEQLPTKKEFMKEFFDDKGQIREDKEGDLRNKLRGRISYLRPMSTSAKREEMGVKSPWMDFISVYPSAMSQFQYEYAKKSLEDTQEITMTYKSKSGKMITATREIKGGAVRILARDAASFVFPVFKQKKNKWVVSGGEYGTAAFEKNIKPTLGGRGYKYADPKVAEAIKTDLEKYSSKFAAILKEIKNNPEELVFIYDEYVAAGGGGAINLALVLQEHGFVWAKSASDISKPDGRGRKRFAVITSNKATTHGAKQVEDLIASFNRQDNIHGERCQIIIGSRKIAEGITIKNVRQGHVTMPHWNIPAIDQALGRILRVGSHDLLPPKERYVKIYRHVAVKEHESGDGKIYNKGLGYPDDVGFSSEETMDVHVYKIAEEKDHYITQLYRLIKEIAWDCPLAYERNVLEGDKDGSRACDYTECNYMCSDYPEEYVDQDEKVWKYTVPENAVSTDTYDMYYSGKNIKEMIGRIVDLFGVYFSLRLDMIASLIGIESEDENHILLKALDQILNTRLLIRNRYGFGNYLKEQGNIYFLDDTISSFSNYPESTYVATPLISERTSLEDLVEVSQISEDKDLVKKFCKDPVKNSHLLGEMHYRTLIVLLEKIKEFQYTSDKRKQKLMGKQKAAVDEVIKSLGRNLVSMPGGMTIHNMLASEYTGLGYNVTVQEIKPTGMMRVFDPKIQTWRYVESEEEEEKYIDRLKQLQKAKGTVVWEVNPYGVYGFRDRDGKFKIRVKPQPGQRETKGSVCMEASWSILRIYKLYHDLGELPPPMKDLSGYSTKDLIRDIKAQPNLAVFKEGLEKKSPEELRRILSLHSMNKKQLCDALEKWFIEHDLFEDLRV